MTPRAGWAPDWLSLARSVARPEIVLALFALPLWFASCVPDTPPDEVRTIEGFVQCLDNRAIAQDISAAVQCLPPRCTLTLTKSEGSAQPACSVGGCQLPRVLLNCPGPPQLQPSFSLCVTDSGLDRVEIGETINLEGHMRMGDVHVGPGFTVTDPSEPVSKVTDTNSDSADCWTCHQHDTFPNGADAISKPEPYQIFGVNCVIGTDEPCQHPDAGNCNGSEQVTPQTLEDVCACISAGVHDDLNPLSTAAGLRAEALCEALVDYQQTRGICGSADLPTPSGPTCSLVGEHCDPYQDGAIHSTPTGYTCQEVAPGENQCVSSRQCVDYALQGGGKFIGDDGVSLVRLLVSGKAAVDGDCPICDSTGISSQIRAFNHAANTVVSNVQLSSLTATDDGGGDLTAQGDGTALVDGVDPANVHFEASKAGGAVEFDLEDSDAVSPLAGGTGEAGRADFSLSGTPIP